MEGSGTPTRFNAILNDIGPGKTKILVTVGFGNMGGVINWLLRRRVTTTCGRNFD